MNVAEFIVTAINILQIIECSSPSPATLEILFCLFSHLIIHPIHERFLILQTIPILLYRLPMMKF